LKSITENSIFKIRCTVDSAPRDIYLVKDLANVKKLFKNAYVLSKVDWTKIANFYQFMSGTDLSEILSFPYSRWSPATSKLAANIKLINSGIKLIRDDVLAMYTVVPFVPSIGDYRSNIKEWGLSPEVMVLVNSRNLKNASLNQASKFYSILLANSHNMGLIVEGVLYESPCRLCKFVLSKLAGKCEIYKNNNQVTQMCSPRLTFNAQLFTDREVSTLQNVDYAEAYTLFSKDQKMEV